MSKLSLVNILLEILESQTKKFWITPDNEIIPVEDHLKFIKQKNLTSIDAYKEYFDAIFNGWTRISITPDEFNISANSEKNVIHIIRKFYLNLILKNNLNVYIDLYEPHEHSILFNISQEKDKIRFKKFVKLDM